MQNPRVKIVPITELTPDQFNANLGTPRGNQALEKSIQTSGHGRSGLIDKNGKIIGGNKFYEKSGELGAEEVIIIESDGTKPIFVQRVDLDLDEDERARLLAYWDNAVAQQDLSWDVTQIAADIDSGLPLDSIWEPEELAQFLGVDKPPFEGDKGSVKQNFILKVRCNSAEQMAELYNKLVDEGWDVLS